MRELIDLSGHIRHYSKNGVAPPSGVLPLLKGFERALWLFDEDRYEGLYQLALSDNNIIRNADIKFVAWDNDYPIEDDYPRTVAYRRYGADALRDMKNELREAHDEPAMLMRSL